MQQAAQFYIDFYTKEGEERVCCFHDAFPLAHLIQPDLFEMTEGNIRVSTDDLNRGQTIVAPFGSTASPLWTEAQTVKVATKVDAERLEALFIDTYAK